MIALLLLMASPGQVFTIESKFVITPEVKTVASSVPEFIIKAAPVEFAVKSVPVRIAMTYDEGLAVSRKTKKPLLVWVGQKQPKWDYPDVLHCEVDSFPDAVGPCCVVSKHGNGILLRLADLPGTPTPVKVQSILEPPPVQRAVFQQPAVSACLS